MDQKTWQKKMIERQEGENPPRDSAECGERVKEGAGAREQKRMDREKEQGLICRGIKKLK